MGVITDRNDLDDQLFGQFQRCEELLRQTPVQAENRSHLRELLQVASGGIVFTTLQKFQPEEKGDRMLCLSDRENIVVIADEAHRSQYGLVSGFARNLRDSLPGASFIGFTGTPIEKTDANTRAVFGEYVSVYDIERAVEDESTVPIYYESRIAKLSLNEQALQTMDDEFDAITEDEEGSQREKLNSKWAALEVLVGEEKRIALIAKDLVAHFERRREAMEGKSMVVCMSRRICVDLHKALIALRPDWAGAANDRGESLGLNPDEIAFYDALANNESAVRAMGNDELKVIAAELVTKVRQSVTIDWTVRENARARIRVMVRRILNKHGDPPDLQEEAVQTVLRQAEALCGGWAV